MTKSVVMIMAGLTAIWSAVYTFFLLRSVVWGMISRSWPTVSGRISKSEVVRIKRSETLGIGLKYRADILFEYQVGDIRYWSNALSFPYLTVETMRRGQQSKRSAAYLVKKFPLDQHVMVHYSPENPGRATLETRVLSCNLLLNLLLMTGILIMSASFVIGYYWVNP